MVLPRIPERISPAICAFSALILANSLFANPPRITGRPEFDSAPQLEWPYDNGPVLPDLSDSTANNLIDLHGTIDSCDMLLSSEGNYHMALREAWTLFLQRFKKAPLRNAIYSTSPPVFFDQAQNVSSAISIFDADPSWPSVL